MSENQLGSGDIWWQQITNSQRQMTPVAGARIVNLGVVDFDALTHAELQNLVYGNAPIPGNAGKTRGAYRY